MTAARLYRWRVRYMDGAGVVRSAGTRGPWAGLEEIRQALRVHGLELLTAERVT